MGGPADHLRNDINTDDAGAVPGTGGIENPESPEAAIGVGMTDYLTDAADGDIGTDTELDSTVEDELERPDQ
ncbi:hypothetical protein [Desertivibrio insolitus]|uniref:hypothetical protein n=1 Tax=Herbiconiux sp. SYSU D00978 TaxID=2812562 RepID=UPI001A9775CD|nr:hypothetical protein [Herbiconiux sp. SYSU D00978]